MLGCCKDAAARASLRNRSWSWASASAPALQLLAKLLEGACPQNPHGPRGARHAPRNFGKIEAFEVTQDQDLPVVRRQTRQGIGEEERAFLAHGGEARRRLVFREPGLQA